MKNLASLKKKAKEGNVVSQHKVGSYYYKKKDYKNKDFLKVNFEGFLLHLVFSEFTQFRSNQRCNS